MHASFCQQGTRTALADQMPRCLGSPLLSQHTIKPVVVGNEASWANKHDKSSHTAKGQAARIPIQACTEAKAPASTMVRGMGSSKVAGIETSTDSSTDWWRNCNLELLEQLSLLQLSLLPQPVGLEQQLGPREHPAPP